VKIGTRGSQLARWQADWVRARLADNDVRAEIVVIKTRGDADVDRPLHELEGKGFFTKEIEDALLDGRRDEARPAPVVAVSARRRHDEQYERPLFRKVEIWIH